MPPVSVTEVDPVRQQVDIAAQRPGQRLPRLMGRKGFRQTDRHCDRGHHAEHRQGQEDRLPAPHPDHQPARQWRKDRRQAGHQHQLRIHLGRGHYITLVADHRAGNHHARATAEGLHETCADQPFQRRRIGAGEGGQSKQRDPAEQRHTTTKAVRQRAVDQLADGQAAEIHRQGQLDMFFIGGERRRHRRETRQVKVDRQRREGAQGAQNQEYAQVHQAPKYVGSPTV